jgi:hypothetical protein
MIVLVKIHPIVLVFSSSSSEPHIKSEVDFLIKHIYVLTLESVLRYHGSEELVVSDGSEASNIEPLVELVFGVTSSYCLSLVKSSPTVDACKLSYVGYASVVLFPVDTIIVGSVVPGLPFSKGILSFEG